MACLDSGIIAGQISHLLMGGPSGGTLNAADRFPHLWFQELEVEEDSPKELVESWADTPKQNKTKRYFKQKFSIMIFLFPSNKGLSFVISKISSNAVLP